MKFHTRQNILVNFIKFGKEYKATNMLIYAKLLLLIFLCTCFLWFTFIVNFRCLHSKVDSKSYYVWIQKKIKLHQASNFEFKMFSLSHLCVQRYCLMLCRKFAFYEFRVICVCRVCVCTTVQMYTFTSLIANEKQSMVGSLVDWLVGFHTKPKEDMYLVLLFLFVI